MKTLSVFFLFLTHALVADLSVNVSFLYLYAGEDGLDLANSAGFSAGEVVATNASTTLNQDFEYNPGFKVGLGASWTNFSLNLDYTWFCQETRTESRAPDVWITNDWFQQLSPSGQALSGPNLTSTWNLALHLTDLTLRYPLSGCPVSFIPFFGLRGIYLFQKLNLTLQALSHNTSHGWGLGPRTGFDFCWRLPQGFRVEGGAAASLYFMQYTDIKHSEDVASPSAIPCHLSVQLSPFNAVRSDFELSLGVGYQTCAFRRGILVDLGLRYAFYLFPQQNMLRKLADQTFAGTGASPGSLYLHGLTLEATTYW